MKILYITGYYKPAYVYGGPVRSVSALCEGMVNAGAKITVYTTNANGKSYVDVPLCRPVNVDGVEVHYFPVTLPRSYFYSPVLSRAVKSAVKLNELVVIDALWIYPLIPTAFSCLKNSKPYVLSIRGQLHSWALKQKSLKKSLYLNFILKKLINRSNGLHCTDLQEVMAIKALHLRSPLFVVPNSIDLTRFDEMPQRGKIRKRYSIPNEAIVLLFVGRLTRIKRPDIAIKALSEIRASGYQAHLLIVGPDVDKLSVKLHHLAEFLKCNHHVHFTGLLEGDDLLTAYADSDIFIMPTEIQENFGMAALEAFASGVPSVVSKGVPVGYWGERAGAGFVAPANEIAFSEKILSILNNPEERRRMGENGRLMVKNYFCNEVVAQEMMLQFDSIIKTGKPRIGEFFL